MQPSPTLELACELLTRPSITPEDSGCQALLMARLQRIGFHCEPMNFAEVTNFYARKGDASPVVCFAGHTDVVPTGKEELWHSPPFSPSVRDGMLYARGAADMKGSLAAITVAIERFIQDYPTHRGAIAMLVTSDEEGPAQNGTVKVIEQLQARNEHLDMCIVGEPSSSKQVGDIIKNGRRGSLGLKLIINGTQGHIAYPHLAANPIHLALPALSELTQHGWDKGNQYFPATSLQISNINAGTGATNVIPGELEVLANFRFSTEVTAAELRQRTHAILDKHQLDYQCHWQLSGEPFLTAQGELLKACQSAILKHTGLNPQLSTSGGTSDGRFIAPTGAQVIELGPCNDSIHKINEAVSVADLNRLTDIYYDILKNLLVA